MRRQTWFGILGSKKQGQWEKKMCCWEKFSVPLPMVEGRVAGYNAAVKKEASHRGDAVAE